MERNNTSWFASGVRMGLTALCAAAFVGCVGGEFAGNGTDLTPGDNPAFGDDDDGDDNGNGDDVTTTANLRGYVETPLGLPLDGVLVTAAGGFEAETGADGRFELPDVPVDDRVGMTFSRDGYATTSGSYMPTDGGANYFAQTMAPVDLETEFDSSDGIDFIIDETHGFSIPADSILRLDGTEYDGVVSLSATVWDRTTPPDEGSEFMASPGNGRGITDEGDDVLLYTFGMFQVILQDVETNEVLQAGPGVRIAVEVPEDSNLQDGESVEYWDFDGNQSTWSETDNGQIVDLPGGGQVWEFEPTEGLEVRTTTLMMAGNPDKPIIVTTTSQAKGTVTEPDGTPIQGAPVAIVAADQTFMVNTQTDANGEFTATVPPVVGTPIGPNGRPMFIEVDYEVATQPSLWRANPVSPVGPGGTLDFGTIAAGSMTCLAGQVVDAAGNPVAGVNVSSPHGGNAVSDNDGNFEMNVPKWQPSTAYAVSPTAGLGFKPAKFRPVPMTSSSCPNQVVLEAYAETTCAAGTVTIDGWEAEGIQVDAFDARYPSVPVFSTTTSAGDYCVTIPADVEVTVRVGAGVNALENACGSYTLSGAPGVDGCQDGFCEDVPAFECGQ